MTTAADIPAIEQVEATPAATAASVSSCSNLSAAKVSDRFKQIIPRDFAREHLILSQGFEGEAERLVIASTSDPAAVFNTGVMLGTRIETITVDGELIAHRIDEAYQARSDSSQDASSGASGTDTDGDHDNLPGVDALLAAADRDLLTTQGKGPVVKLVDAILFEALSRHASDVHVQPLADRTLVRYRLDGVLHTVRQVKGAKRANGGAGGASRCDHQPDQGDGAA